MLQEDTLKTTDMSHSLSGFILSSQPNGKLRNEPHEKEATLCEIGSAGIFPRTILYEMLSLRSTHNVSLSVMRKEVDVTDEICPHCGALLPTAERRASKRNLSMHSRHPEQETALPSQQLTVHAIQDQV